MEIRTSESVKEICVAMAKAQPCFGVATKNAKGFNYKYATLEDYTDISKKALSENDLFIMQFPSFSDGRVHVTTRLYHKSGEFFETSLSIRPKNDTDQEIGKCITYARRYAYASLLGLVGTDADPDEAESNQPSPQRDVRKGNAPKVPTNQDFLKKIMEKVMEEYNVENKETLRVIYAKLRDAFISDYDLPMIVRAAFDKSFKKKGD